MTRSAHVVVAIADHLGREDVRRGRQRVDRRVDAERGDLACEVRGGVEVRERGERRRVGVVVGRHVHRLQRRDRVTLRGRDPLLELAHLVGEGGLVTHRRGHAAEQRGHFRARLHETEDVVDEEQHVLVLHVTEVLGDGERRQRDAQAHARRLVHLAVDQRGLLDDARLLHLQPQVGAFTRPLAHTGEHRHTTVLGGDPVDHLLDEHGLAHAGAAEQADLAALDVGLEQVDDLDAGLEHLRPWLELVERRRVAVDLPPVVDVGELRLGDVERLADDVEHVAEHAVADRHRDAVTEVADHGAAAQAVGGLQADGADAAVTDLLGDLGRDRDRLALELGDHLDAPCRSRAGRRVGTRRRRPGPAIATTRPSFRSFAPGGSAVMVMATPVPVAVASGRPLRAAKNSASRPSMVSARRSSWRTPPRRASAPPTISMISVVIASWRARFIPRREVGDEVFGVVGGGLHRPLPRRVLGRRRVEQRGVHARVDVARQQQLEDAFRRRLELVRSLHRGVVAGARGRRRPRRVRAASAVLLDHLRAHARRNACRRSRRRRRRRRGKARSPPRPPAARPRRWDARRSR